ncbi:protein Dok-7 isoform X2 [Danio aesculapii]|uniref:protein Dok-7 isoform X2 n=1 Tax=Danio aesculapii TaxID=1142201 RepID=UPI0024BF60D2|nr:protein Dok-7 isoform X2 [Danio aesculapii]
MSHTVIAEGAAKIRDGKKWKSRWLILRKPSPVADCLLLCMYRERGVSECVVLTLEHVCGLQSSDSADGVSHTLSILSLSQSAEIGFDSRAALQNWETRLRYCLGEVHSFSVCVLPGTKLESGAATLHLCNDVLVIAKDHPVVIMAHWNLLDLRRYGAVHNGFVFEGGTRCGYWAGVFFLSCAEGEHISFLFDCIVRGISPSRGPFGLKPLLPELSVSAASVQDRLNHEAEELERRLSLLSHATASSCHFGSSMMGDDRSISGSSDTSDTSQSDCSISSRHALWPDLHLLTETPQSEASQLEEKLSSDPACSRKLKETGRQNSSDSGIATGSHSSSYTGSFSSYSGSLDAAGPGQEYSTQLHLHPPTVPEKHLCVCNHEYLVPSSLHSLYDTPRRLLEISGETFTRKQPQEYPESVSQSDSGSALEAGKGEESMNNEGLVKGEELKTGKGSAKGEESKTGKGSVKGEDSKTGEKKGEELKISENSVKGEETEIREGSEKGEESNICEGSVKVEESLEFSCSKRCCECMMCSLPAAGFKTGISSSLMCRRLKGTFPPLSGRTSGTPTNHEPLEFKESCPTNQNSSSVNPPTNEKAAEGYVSCLSDLLSHYNPVVKSECRSVYESMSSRHPAAHSKHTVLYENCVQCRTGEGHCRTTRSRDCSFQDHLKRNSISNIPESSCSSSVEPLSRPVSLQRTPEEENRERIWPEKARTDPDYEIMDSRTERNSESDEWSRYDLLSTSAGSQKSFHPATDEGSDRLRDAVTYVNIPISPACRKQLNYMDLELQESSAVAAFRGRNCSKYAQIDISVMEAAHRAGSQHALGREEGLQRLEHHRRRSRRNKEE